MENATDALSMAFAMIVFVLAIAIAFMLFSQVNAVAKSVLFINDRSNYVTYVDQEEYRPNRVVGIEDIMPTLYSYTTEHYMVTIDFNTYKAKYDGSGNIVGPEYTVDGKLIPVGGHVQTKMIDFYLENEIENDHSKIKKHIDGFISGGGPFTRRYGFSLENAVGGNYNDEAVRILNKYNFGQNRPSLGNEAEIMPSGGTERLYVTMSKTYAGANTLMYYKDKKFVEVYTKETVGERIFYEDDGYTPKLDENGDPLKIKESEYEHITYKLLQ